MMTCGGCGEMNSVQVKAALSEVGVFKSGIAVAEPVDEAVAATYDEWLSDHRHASMGYLEKYSEIRRDVSLLLPGARSVVSCAFNYYPGKLADSPLQWASYALGDDYHDVVRSRLTRVADEITRLTGAECRVCVDTAPIFERYWAVRSGVGFVGLNRQLIVPGAGSHFFLGEIVTTLALDADEPCGLSCGGCRRCLSACPGGALTDGGIDANRCLSYLTIEHRGDFPEGTRTGRHVYGCDVCQDVCPHNQNAPVTDIEEFRPRPAILALDAAAISAMSQEEFSTLFRRSAIKRTKLAGLLRNAKHIGGGGEVTGG